MKYPKSICDSCPYFDRCDDTPCNDRIKNLSEIKKFEDKLKRKFAKEIARYCTDWTWKEKKISVRADRLVKIVVNFINER
jgi:hypothetical protein